MLLFLQNASCTLRFTDVFKEGRPTTILLHYCAIRYHNFTDVLSSRLYAYETCTFIKDSEKKIQASSLGRLSGPTYVTGLLFLCLCFFDTKTLISSAT